MREIAEVIGRGLKLPVISLSEEEAQAHFGWLALFAGYDMPASSAQTRKRLGWTPTGPGLIAGSALWVVLATAVITALAVGAGSLTGSRAVTLTAIIGWQTVASGMLYLATFLGAARDLVLVFAVSRFQPGPAIGTRVNPGSTNALNNLKLPMPAVTAVLVILAWLIAAAAAGAWRTRTRDA